MNAEQFLRNAADIMRERGKTRDKQGGERSMKRTVEAFNAATGHKLTERDGWLFMVALKLARAASTPSGLQDDYEDGAAYFALAGESVAPKDKLPPILQPDLFSTARAAQLANRPATFAYGEEVHLIKN